MAVQQVLSSFRSRVFCFLFTMLCALIFAANANAQTVNCSGVAAWAPNTSYTAGQLVTYSGSEYRCLQSHTSLTGWEPPNVPALWSLVGTCSSATPTPTPTPSPTPKPSSTPTPTPTPSPRSE